MRNSLKNIACAISGGVDSCVAALLLKNRGYNVLGVFMRNWDIFDEQGYCQTNKDKEDAEYICKKIGIPFLEVDFVKEYWNNVFSEFLQDYVNGLTPNPDILCNKEIKFKRFYEFAFNDLKVDAIATGHYARIVETTEHSWHLWKALDQNKDQTFFLSQIPQDSLKRCLFPLGNLTKSVVKKIAMKEGFKMIADKKESMGICFVGRRNFQSFISDYIEPTPGNFIHIENGSCVGSHQGIHCWTEGQRCHIAGQPTAFYVAKKNAKNQDIFVAPGSDHPALLCQTFVASVPYWITPKSPNLRPDQAFECDFRFQHRQQLIKCLIYSTARGKVHVFLEKTLKALTPGQYAVFYKEEECLGSARIVNCGPSLFELSKIYL